MRVKKAEAPTRESDGIVTPARNGHCFRGGWKLAPKAISRVGYEWKGEAHLMPECRTGISRV